MARKRRNRRKPHKPQKPSPNYIMGVYEMFDDDDISTERLLAMVADSCGCDVDDVVEALVLDGRRTE